MAPPAAVSAFLVIQVLSGSTFITSSLGADALRIVSIVPILQIAYANAHNDRGIDYHQAFRARQVAVVKAWLAGYALWAFSSTLAHGILGTFAMHLGGSLLLILIVSSLANDGGKGIARAAPPILLITMLTSLLMGLLAPDEALAGDRLRGFLVNANLLGFYAFISTACALLLIRRLRWRVLALIASLWVLVWTGSRTSALAVLVLVLGLALAGHRLARSLLLLAGALWLAALVGVVDFSDSVLFRTEGTRSDSMNEAARVWATQPILGTGAGQGLAEVASSPLRAFAEGGLIGLLGVVIMYIVLLCYSIRRGPGALAFSLASLVHALGEGWLLSSLGAMLVQYFVVWVAIEGSAHPSPVPKWSWGRRRQDDSMRAHLGPVPRTRLDLQLQRRPTAWRY